MLEWRVLDRSRPRQFPNRRPNPASPGAAARPGVSACDTLGLGGWHGRRHVPEKENAEPWNVKVFLEQAINTRRRPKEKVAVAR